MQDEVKVTQADIEAVRHFYNNSSANLTGQELVELEQAFARHRQQADRGEVVAWMYERGEHRVVVPLSERASHMTEHGWTETPLYTLPTPPEAAA